MSMDDVAANLDKGYGLFIPKDDALRQVDLTDGLAGSSDTADATPAPITFKAMADATNECSGGYSKIDSVEACKSVPPHP